MMFPVLVMAQGQKGTVETCAPMKDGKVCYTDQVEMNGMTQATLFEAVSKWAKKEYGRDVFLSNLSTNKKKGSIMVSSKMELLLNETDKTMVKYKMSIQCKDNGYSIELKDLVYQYDPQNNKQFKTYPAEHVIASNGLSNTVAIIKDPKLFCNATFFMAEQIFSNVLDAAQEAE